jgi:hypothetical protein
VPGAAAITCAPAWLSLLSSEDHIPTNIPLSSQPHDAMFLAMW